MPGLIARVVLVGLLSSVALAATAQDPEKRYCGTEGVWLQILGSGGPQFDDRRAGASYLVWIDNHARLLIDAGPGSSLRFEEAGASIEDLDAIAFTHLHADHASDFPGFVKASYFVNRERPLPVLGPDGNDLVPSMKIFVERMIGLQGAFSYLSDFLTHKSSGGYKISARNVPSTGQRRWSRFGSANLRLASVPVHHGPIPAVAWRVEIGGQSIVFTGDFSNQKNTITKFAKDTDALVIHHAIPESTRGTARELHVMPTQIGRIAHNANVRMVILGHRMSRTRGVESLSEIAIRKAYDGPLIFANDLECWGL
jgi:ribonuclease BN (tRNA processing enzyme)